MIKKLSGFLAFVICVFTIVPTSAKADLTIMPIRIVFENRDRSAELSIINTSKTTNTYRLEWGYRRAKEEGGYESLEAPLESVFDPAKNLVFSPKQVTIPPGESQRVRISLRRPADLPDGEYRAHLVMKKISGTSGTQPVGVKGGAPSLNVQMATNVGFSLPVIVRQGEYDAGATISDPQFIAPASPGQSPVLSLMLNRTGIHSITGSVKVYWAAPGQDEILVGQMNNINLFHELTKRKVGIELTEKAITSGTIHITFEGVDKNRGTIYHEQSFPVGG